jgi:hypothetical protein
MAAAAGSKDERAACSKALLDPRAQNEPNEVEGARRGKSGSLRREGGPRAKALCGPSLRFKSPLPAITLNIVHLNSPAA